MTVVNWPSSVYPTSIDSYTPRTIDAYTTVSASHVNTLAEGVEALETKLGITGGVATGFGGLSFTSSGKASNPGGVGEPTLWCDNASANFVLTYTDELGTDHPLAYTSGTYWDRTGTTLSPVTSGDTLNIAASGAAVDISSDTGITLTTSGTSDLDLDAGGGLLSITDSYQGSSTYSTAMPFASSASEWSNFVTNFGDGTSLLAAINSSSASYWDRTGTTLSPVTSGDTLNIAASGAAVDISSDTGVILSTTGGNFNISSSNSTSMSTCGLTSTCTFSGGIASSFVGSFGEDASGQTSLASFADNSESLVEIFAADYNIVDPTKGNATSRRIRIGSEYGSASEIEYVTIYSGGGRAGRGSGWWSGTSLDLAGADSVTLESGVITVVRSLENFFIAVDSNTSGDVSSSIISRKTNTSGSGDAFVYIEASAGDGTSTGVGKILFYDSYRDGTTYTEAYMPFSENSSEWTDFATNFGDGTSLLAAINSAYSGGGGLNTSSGGDSMYSNTRGDFSVAYSSGTELTVSGLPFNISAENIVAVVRKPTGTDVSIQRIRGTDLDCSWTPGSETGTGTITVSSSWFVGTDTFTVLIEGPEKGFDKENNANRSLVVNPDSLRNSIDSDISYSSLTGPGEKDLFYDMTLGGYHRLGMTVTTLTDVTIKVYGTNKLSNSAGTASDWEDITLLALGTQQVTATGSYYCLDRIPFSRIWIELDYTNASGSGAVEISINRSV